MAYLALYRRFRPTEFSKVIGQDVIVKTLTNQIMNDKVGHAYLFCGARGTGKTSLAKIFAKAVNCLEPINGSPCGKCLACQNLNDPSNIDILEMDAASNNKVENVREIRENIQYPPIGVKYKVFIIDEVHMLTPEAFNALLKTLEEPPKHAIFILATTEPQKLPATILSRCMRFDFRLIETAKLAKLVSNIYDEIGKKYTSEAVMAIAKAGDGSVRDALSVADLCVSVGNSELNYDDVLSVLGATDINKTDEIIKAIFISDVGSVLSLTNELLSLGKSIGVLAKDLTQYLRDLIVVKKCKNAKDILSIPEERYELMQKTASIVDSVRMLRVLEILSSIENGLRFSTQPRSVLESALLKASLPENDCNIEALLSRIKVLEEKIKNFNERYITVAVKDESKTQAVNSVEVAEKSTLESVKIEELAVKITPAVSEVKEDDISPKSVSDKVETVEKPSNSIDGKRVWGTVIRKLRGMPGKTVLWVACQEMTAFYKNNALYVNVSSESEKNLILKEENLKTIKEITSTFGDFDIKIASESDVEKIDHKEKLSEFFKDTLEIK